MCVSIMDWDWPFWTSRQHLMRQLARRNRVLFVDPPLTYASDYLGARSDPRLRHKLTSWCRHGGLTKRSENLLVWSPPPSIPFNRVKNRLLFQRLLDFNQAIFRESLRRTVDRVGFRRPILWISFNAYYGAAVLGRLGEAVSVYHCTDQLSAFPGLHPFVSDIEQWVASEVDLVLTSSEVLRETMARHNPNSRFVPNGADVELFEQALSWKGPEPGDLRSLAHPRAGFIGGIEFRFDADLVAYAAHQMPSWSFVLIGLVQEGNPEVDQLRALPNVHFLGLKARTELPGYLASLDVSLIPYKINELTRGIYPLKLHEYLAAGLPVVATPIPSLQNMADVIYLADDGPSFVEALQRAAEEDSPRRHEQRRKMAQSHDWGARAVEISHALDEVLRVKEPLLDPDRSAAGKPRAPYLVPDAPIADSRLPLGAYLRLGSALSRRHKGLIKQLTYQLVGDLNIHRRVRIAHVLGMLRSLQCPQDEILDAGCGQGALSIALASALKGSRVLGVDIEPTNVTACRTAARALLGRTVDFQQADLADLPFSDRFDVAVCVDVMEHIPDDGAALRNLYRALKPGGRLLVHVPMRHQLQWRLLPMFKKHTVSDHVRDEYLPKEIVAKVEGAGFRVDSFGATFGPAGEIAFELNTFSAGLPIIGQLLTALTYPVALALGYLDVAAGAGARGNSFLIVATKSVVP